MNGRQLVRIISMDLNCFKNVSSGRISFISRSSVIKEAKLAEHDTVGIYGQNGSGKTAVIEAAAIMEYVLKGEEIPYDGNAGLISQNHDTKLGMEFFIENDLGNKYRADYKIELGTDDEKKKIRILSEQICFFTWKNTWKEEKRLSFSNPFYDSDAILDGRVVHVTSKPLKYAINIGLDNIVQKVAIACAQNNTSVFFSEFLLKAVSSAKQEQESGIRDVIVGLHYFAEYCLQIVKVNQLGAINLNILPVNIHSDMDGKLGTGCLYLVMNGNMEIPEILYNRMKDAFDAINIALAAIVPNLQVEMYKSSEEIRPDVGRVIKVELYSIRDGKRFSIKYESEGIKRIVSLLQFLIALYNSPEVCLFVDELDSGIFEYLLGDLLEAMEEDSKGQLVFTSHNLRVLEMLPKENIIFTTTNPNNRYVRMTGVGKNNNLRDLYIRTITIGGQKEELYDASDLDSVGRAFRRAGHNNRNVNLLFSDKVEAMLASAGKEDGCGGDEYGKKTETSD